jgi:hypothetical protein
MSKISARSNSRLIIAAFDAPEIQEELKRLSTSYERSYSFGDHNETLDSFHMHRNIGCNSSIGSKSAGTVRAEQQRG